METYQAALDLLPERFRKAAAALPQRGAVSEFRLRCGRKATALLSGEEQPLCSELVSQSDLQRTLELCSGASPYAAESLRLGYLTARCGVRVGFCGEAVEGAGRVKTLKGISSAAIRIPREVYGCAAGLCDIPFASTLILSPPGIGKTTRKKYWKESAESEQHNTQASDELI